MSVSDIDGVFHMPGTETAITKDNKTKFRYCATILAPGYMDHEYFWAVDLDDANEQKREWNQTSWKGVPSVSLSTIEVDPKWDVALLPDGTLLYREEYEARFGPMEDAA